MRRLQQVHQFMHNDIFEAFAGFLGKFAVEANVALDGYSFPILFSSAER